MTLNEPGPRGASVGFAERLLEVIDSSRRTATYKLALLIALLDLCTRLSDADGRAPRLLYTRDIAEQVAVLYWPQVIPYLVPGADTAVELRQITLPRAAIIAAVSAFRRAAVAAGATSWHLARQRLPRAYQAMLDQVEVTVAEQPLPRLQAVGSSDTVFPFLYELSWGLLPGAGDELLRLGPLVPAPGRAALDQDGRGDQQGSHRRTGPAPSPVRIGPDNPAEGTARRHRRPAERPVLFAAAAPSAPRQRPITSSRGSAAASPPSRTWCWPTGGATTTNATCSLRPRM